MRLTVAVPPEHRNTLLEGLPESLEPVIEWWSTSGADVVIGMPGQANLASCEIWPGLEGAVALVRAGWERLQDQRDMERLNQVGRALASEQNLDKLLDLILRSARELLDAEAGSIYLVVEENDNRELLFAHTQNAKVQLPYHRFRMPISKTTLAGFVAATGDSLNIEDVYHIPEDAPYKFNDAFDKQSRYRTTSMLVVPMTGSDGETLGVLQLINRVTKTPDGELVAPFLASHQALAQSLAGQAGVAVKNAELRTEIEALFEGFVNASVTAIESRDPVTSGHSGRVANLTVGLAEAVNLTRHGIFGELHFSDRQLREIRYASLLHDFGKVGVREQVLVKAKKLDPEKLEIILQRLRQRGLEESLELLAQTWKGGEHFDPSRWERLIQDRQAETERLIHLVRQSNEPSVLPQDVAENLGLLGSLSFTHWSGGAQPVVEEGDLASLRIRKGSLSEAERLEIESHVTHTFRFLQQIPWTRDLNGIPEIAYAHHERLTGTGYPRKLKATEIPTQSRAMAIADVFDALTARDRPYKGAVPLEKSLDILGEEAKHGHLDADLLGLFVEAKVFDRVMKPAG
ncbi:MAG TPA: HD domain-containing phosphohydrolase [Holophagaceae bacterium]|nr:HD domain-containing phosphohydrolase [Holophagaceae bacterium]